MIFFMRTKRNNYLNLNLSHENNNYYNDMSFKLTKIYARKILTKLG